jgi:hypothetical protein
MVATGKFTEMIPNGIKQILGIRVKQEITSTSKTASDYHVDISELTQGAETRDLAGKELAKSLFAQNSQCDSIEKTSKLKEFAGGLNAKDPKTGKRAWEIFWEEEQEERQQLAKDKAEIAEIINEIN